MERYKEYKDSGVKWLGEIPSHWEVVKLKRCAIIKTGTTPPTSNLKYFENGDIPWFTPGDINDMNLHFSSKTITKKAIKDNVGRLFPAESIYFVGIGATVGKVAACDFEASSNQQINAIMCNDRLDYKFATYCLLMEQGIIRETTNFVTLPILNQSSTGLIDIVLPPLSEQDSIVRYLDSATSEIDKAIAMQQKMIDLLNERKQIIIQNAVTKGLDENVEMKESGVEWIGRIPKHWEVRKIKTVANFNPLPQRKFQQDEIVGYLPMERLGLGSMNPSEISYGKMPVGLNYIEDGDVVIAKVTPCFENGKIAIAKNLKNGCAFGTSEIFVYRPIKIDSVFLLYSLQNEQLKNKCASTMMGTGGLKRVNASFAKNVYITFPPTEKEQNEIGLFLENKISTFNKTIENIQRQIILLQERKQIIINEVVTGKVRVS